jgi:predicted ABC-type exoprotein transport system permease subunit
MHESVSEAIGIWNESLTNLCDNFLATSLKLLSLISNMKLETTHHFFSIHGNNKEENLYFFVVGLIFVCC